jgi:hypothetical protein
MTGGTLDLGNHFLLGSATATGNSTNNVANHSGGTITTTANFVIADQRGGSTYNLSGNAVVNAGGVAIIGRQEATGVMNQTGGTLAAANGVSVGNAQNATTTLWGTGTYNVSAGTITANQTTGTALNIAPQGTGTFRVIGDDATIDVNGNMTVNTVAGTSQGTLAFQLETGDLLSLVDVSGNATFNTGAILALDTSLASPTQTSYDVVTALDIIDNGLVFNGPAGWGFQIVAGGNGEILRLSQTGPVGVSGDYNNNGTVDAADYVLWRDGGPLANEVDTPGIVNQQDYVEWRARFGNNGPGSSLGGGAQVPEPATVAFLLISSLGLLLRCGRIR